MSFVTILARRRDQFVILQLALAASEYEQRKQMSGAPQLRVWQAGCGTGFPTDERVQTSVQTRTPLARLCTQAPWGGGEMKLHKVDIQKEQGKVKN